VTPFVRSEGYARSKLVTGVLFAVLGVTILVRLATTVGLRFEGIPGYVLGIALVGLCVARFRAFAKRSGP